MYKLTESTSFPEFYEIPNYSNYLISRSGEVLSKFQFKIMKPNLNKGYHSIYLVRDDGVQCFTKIHRLVAIDFIPNPENKPQVNHIKVVNGFCDKTNNNDWNLEWATCKENINHAFDTGLRTPHMTRPISIRLASTGEVTDFKSISECRKFLNVSKDTVMYRVNKGETRVFPDGYQYREYSEEPWFVPDNIEQSLLENGNSKTVWLKYVLTGEVLKFDNCVSVAKHLNVCAATISKYINTPGQPVLPGYIQLAFVSKYLKWRFIADPYIELGKFLKCPLIQVTNVETGEIRVYPTSVECCEDMKLKKSTLYYRIATQGKSVFPDNCRYGYYPFV